MSHYALQVELKNLSGLLAHVNEDRWSSWAREAADKLAHGSAAPEDVGHAFGGMGSLNDLMITPVNGHAIAPDDVAAVNNELNALRSRIWQLTRER